jgi:isopenicillin N synthase-like dioxygenase
MNPTRIPLIDLAPFYEGAQGAALQPLLAAVDAALRDIGFLCVRGHPVPVETIAETQRTAMAFFDLPPEVKARSLAVRHKTRGYTPLGDHNLGITRAAAGVRAAPPDAFERYRIGPMGLPDDDYTRARRDTVFAPNVWPGESLPAFEPTMAAYHRAMSGLSRDLLQVFALALGLPAAWFEPFVDREMSALVLNHYPAPIGPVPVGQMRASAHTDYGTLTIVAPTRAAGGLQVLRGRKASEGEGADEGSDWEDVAVEPGTFVVNIGDLMAQWTNDRWVSTLHRVVNPPQAEAAQSRRLSLVYFHQPNEDALIECLPTCVSAERPARYAPVTAGEHIGRKIRRHFDVAPAAGAPASASPA